MEEDKNPSSGFVEVFRPEGEQGSRLRVQFGKREGLERRFGGAASRVLYTSPTPMPSFSLAEAVSLGTRTHLSGPG